MNMGRTIYATTDNGRLGAQLDPNTGLVHVWRVNGGTLGGFRIERFDDQKLTAKTLQAFFARKSGY